MNHFPLPENFNQPKDNFEWMFDEDEYQKQAEEIEDAEQNLFDEDEF